MYNSAIRRFSLAITLTSMLLSASAIRAVDFASFETDADADKWLGAHSATYAKTAGEIKARKDLHGYRIVANKDVLRGMVLWSEGYIEIQLNPALTGAGRISTLIFEIANGSRHRDHQQIDYAADEGLIRTREEFGLAHEMIEYEALRIHREILIELDARAGPLPTEFFCFVTPAPRSIRDYHLPHLAQYLKAQKESGHTNHYYKLFEERKAGRDKPVKATTERIPQ